jgi:hypothetical protein
MRFLFATVQSFESDFYGRVGEALAGDKHVAEHVAYSKRSARRLREAGATARSLRELLDHITADDVERERERVVRRYGLDSIEDMARADPACAGHSHDWRLRRVVAHLLALEEVFDAVRPDVLIPEVGTELIRTAAHRVARERGIPTLFLFYTMFPRPLRLFVDTIRSSIVAEPDIRPLSPAEHEEVESFRAEFTARAAPIRAPRALGPSRSRFRAALEYTRSRLGEDRDNEYLRPASWARDHVVGWLRAAAARPLYRPPSERQFLFFPLHVADDYKIKMLIPEWADQAALVESLSAALPPGLELVVKEHPLSRGRNRLSLLRRITRSPGVRLVHPLTSTHELLQRCAGVVVISSTVGFEALLYDKPVLTLGSPTYSGYGLTVDVDTVEEACDAVPTLPEFRPDRERTRRFLHAAMRVCHEGSPVLVDRSDENAAALARSLEAAAAELVRTKRAQARVPVPAA